MESILRCEVTKSAIFAERCLSLITLMWGGVTGAHRAKNCSTVQFRDDFEWLQPGLCWGAITHVSIVLAVGSAEYVPLAIS